MQKKTNFAIRYMYNKQSEESKLGLQEAYCPNIDTLNQESSSVVCPSISQEYQHQENPQEYQCQEYAQEYQRENQGYTYANVPTESNHSVQYEPALHEGYFFLLLNSFKYKVT